MYREVIEYNDRVTDWELLNKFNPYQISSKIAMLEEQIEDYYSLSIGHVEAGVFGLCHVSTGTERLAIHIIEQKEKLANYYKKSTHNMNLLKQVMDNYSPMEQQMIKRYMKSNGTYRPSEIIERLRVDLYCVTDKERTERNRARTTIQRKAVVEHVAIIKESLNKEREVLVI
ncbi:hypothetical protein ERX35_000985 [Macrococcus equipercicus]|uniref:Spore coat protein n=1 Tax=Macrococcus equipercicus TaxID=69967 RepID=A0ABQ6RB57_9STAP|nr:hypothetical protein [Macrococcus equipercicus]KAA1042487.1 hypothetical protein ERX35_000985 [Macrococcus equipercicus]